MSDMNTRDYERKLYFLGLNIWSLQNFMMQIKLSHDLLKKILINPY